MTRSEGHHPYNFFLRFFNKNETKTLIIIFLINNTGEYGIQ